MAYTFRRTKNKAQGASSVQTDVDDYREESNFKYMRYIFWLLVLLTTMIFGSLGYALYKGFPVKVR